MTTLRLALISLSMLWTSCERTEIGADVPNAERAPNNHIACIPYRVDLSESGAYLHRHLISIHFVSNADSVIQLTIPFSETGTTETKAPIDGRNITATLYTGPNVVKFVTPTGAANPQPPFDQNLYSRNAAIGGLTAYTSTPNGKLPPECNITISADQIDFNDGILYSIKQISLNAHPPPP